MKVESKLCAMLIAAIIGVALSIAFGLLPDFAYKFFGQSPDSDPWASLEWIFVIPSLLIGKNFGVTSVSNCPNPFVVNALLAATVFAICFWRFFLKRKS